MTDDRSDAELITASLDEPEVFGELFRRHYRVVYAYAVRSLDPTEGPDVAAAVFVKAFEARRRFDTSYVSARPWLLGIAAHLVSNLYRQRGRQARAFDRVRQRPEPTGGFEDETVDRIHAETARPALIEALAALRPAEREVVTLFVVAELSYREISQALGIGEGTVKSRLHRGRARLRNLLDGFGELIKEDIHE